MFSGDEDRELVESLLGKSSSSSQRIKPRGSISQGDADPAFASNGEDMFKSLYGKGSRSKSNDGILGPNDVVNMFGGDDENSSVDDGIEANLRAQLGDNEVGLVEDTMNSSGLRGDT